MPRPSCSPPPPVPPSVLDALTRQVAEVHLGADHASLVRVQASRHGPEVSLCALPVGVHPADALVGHTVPRRWGASGLVAPAGARPLDRLDGASVPIVAAVVVGRDGHVSHHLTASASGSADDGGLDLGAAAAGGPPVGRLLDLLLRTLGLPTAAPGVPAAEWWRVHWLDAVVTAAAADPRRAPRAEAPLTAVLPPDLVSALVAEPALCGPAGWGLLRALAAEPAPPEQPGPAAVRRALAPFVDPSTASWMDDGCLARWLLASLPPVDELMDLAAALVPSATLAAIERVVRGSSAAGPVR